MEATKAPVSAQVWSCTISFPHLCSSCAAPAITRAGFGCPEGLRPLWRPGEAVLPQERAEVLLPTTPGSGEPPAAPAYLSPLGSVTFTGLPLPLPACHNPGVWDGGATIGTGGKQKLSGFSWKSLWAAGNFVPLWVFPQATK